MYIYIYISYILLHPPSCYPQVPFYVPGSYRFPISHPLAPAESSGRPTAHPRRGASCSHQGWRAWQWHSEPSSSARIRCKCTSGAARVPGAPRMLKRFKRLKFITSSVGFGCSICLVVAVVIDIENGPKISYRAEVFSPNLILLPPHHSRMPKYLWTPGTPQFLRMQHPSPTPKKKIRSYHMFPLPASNPQGFFLIGNPPNPPRSIFIF